MMLRADLWPPRACIRRPTHHRTPPFPFYILYQYSKNECRGEGVKKIWSFRWELKRLFLVKEVTEGREDHAVPGAFSPGFLPHPIRV